MSLKTLDAMEHAGHTPLHVAVLKAQPEMVRRLVEWGASTTCVNNAGYTAAGLARRAGRPELLDALIEGSDNRWLIAYERDAHQTYRRLCTEPFDANRDGNVDTNAATRYLAQWRDVSVGEGDTLAAALLERYDADGNGRLVAAEVLPLLRAIHATQTHPDPRRGSVELLRLKLREFDGNRDGFLSGVEQAMAIRFEMLAERVETVALDQRVRLDVAIPRTSGNPVRFGRVVVREGDEP